MIVAKSTDCDVGSENFDTSSVEAVIDIATALNPNATIVITSTILIGFVEDVRKRLGTSQVIFSPELLREGRGLKDNLHSSRIIVGEHCNNPSFGYGSYCLLKGTKQLLANYSEVPQNMVDAKSNPDTQARFLEAVVLEMIDEAVLR